MSAAVEAPAPEGQLHCKLCGLVYSGEAGRLQYNTFVCTPCGNIDRNIRRNLGDRDGLPTWSCEDQQHFFRQIRESRKGQRVDWKTIKAAFVTSLTTSVINSHTCMVEAEELPLSVWLQRGWEESMVKAQEIVYSQEYQAWVYRVPVKRLTWVRTFSEVEEKVLAPNVGTLSWTFLWTRQGKLLRKKARKVRRQKRQPRRSLSQRTPRSTLLLPKPWGLCRLLKLLSTRHWTKRKRCQWTCRKARSSARTPPCCLCGTTAPLAGTPWTNSNAIRRKLKGRRQRFWRLCLLTPCLWRLCWKPKRRCASRSNPNCHRKRRKAKAREPKPRRAAHLPREGAPKGPPEWGF